MEVIAHIENNFTSKFGIPRQSGIIEELKGRIIFEEKFRDEAAFRGLEEFSHIWLIWGFSENKRKEWSPTVRPPRLGGNKRMGVFATRSPIRPNPIGLSCVKLESIEKEDKFGIVLHVSGADLMNGTPIYDIKPYIVYADCKPEAKSGFVDTHQNEKLIFEENEFSELIPMAQRAEIIKILENDPRPSYHHDDREYGIDYAGRNIRFVVRDKKVSIISVDKSNI